MDVLEFYFQCCSVSLNAKAMSMVAATLANAGICPLTGKRVFQSTTVRDCLSMMYSCGMYDYSGEFAFTIGLPAKSGVAGAIMLVIPGVMGICIWSPRLDELGNSVRGVLVCKELCQNYSFHNFDGIVDRQDNTKQDPRVSKNQQQYLNINTACFAASQGDIICLQTLFLADVDLSHGDYDGRAPLHLAASENRLNIVKFLVEKCQVAISPKDRWGGTPLDDAIREGHDVVREYLQDRVTSSGK